MLNKIKSGKQIMKDLNFYTENVSIKEDIVEVKRIDGLPYLIIAIPICEDLSVTIKGELLK